MIGIEISPTVCAPVESFKILTTNDNAFTLGWIGFIMGAGAVILFWIGSKYVGPWLIEKGFV